LRTVIKLLTFIESIVIIYAHALLKIFNRLVLVSTTRLVPNECTFLQVVF